MVYKNFIQNLIHKKWGVEMNDFKIEVIKNMNEMFYWQIKSKNKRIVAKSEMYTRKEMCYKTAKKIEYGLGDGNIYFTDMTKFDDKDAYLDDENMYAKENL